MKLDETGHSWHFFWDENIECDCMIVHWHHDLGWVQLTTESILKQRFISSASQFLLAPRHLTGYRLIGHSLTKIDELLSYDTFHGFCPAVLFLVHSAEMHCDLPGAVTHQRCVSHDVAMAHL